MYHRFRSLHRWTGLIVALFLLLIASTGFLLATKGTFGWIRPPEASAKKVAAAHQIVSLERVTRSAYALGIPELASLDDIDRIDYRPKSNIFKVVTKRGYLEVQVDGSSGAVLQVARRNDQLAEDIHDLSFFSDLLHDYGLPLVALALLSLASTGIAIFFTPIVRRRRHRAKASAREYTSP